MPLGKTAAAARGGRMLGDEDGMPSERGLLAVIRGLRRRQPPGDEIPRMAEDDLHSLCLKIVALAWGELETLPECGFLQLAEDVLKIPHSFGSNQLR